MVLQHIRTGRNNMTGKNSRPHRQKELAAEKRIADHHLDPDFVAGENFVEEPTGSATMINLDGRRDFDRRP
jgi:hypothetical protein